jgi:hypothetical protein
MHRPGSGAEASEPGIFAELVSISSTRSAGVSDSAYFIKSIELRPTFDLFLGACRGLHFFGRVSSGETLIVWWFCRTDRSTPSATDAWGRGGGYDARQCDVPAAATRGVTAIAAGSCSHSLAAAVRARVPRLGRAGECYRR